MPQTLIITEKPSVAKDIAKVLDCGKRGEGYYYGESHVVSWAVGHLVTLCEPEDYSPDLKRWNMHTLPIIPNEIRLKPIEKTKKQLLVLEKLMNSPKVTDIICATDSGREGELIFRYIYVYAKCAKPFKRLWISSMTDKAIREGFAKLKPGADYDTLYASARCRSEADWLVGINATRAFTVRYNELLSVGRVQTPTLAILVARQKEIDAFVQSDYYEVTADFCIGGGLTAGAAENYRGKWFDPADDDINSQSKIAEKGKADEIAEKVKGKTGEVVEVTNEEKRQPHPLLYDLTELQRDCNRKFGFTAQKTLSVAQDLYEKRKLITYPRTDSRVLSSDMAAKIKQTLEKIGKTDVYAPFAAYIAALPKLPITKRIIDDAKVTDHHAIIPTDTTPNLAALTPDELKVYDLVTRRFLCVFYPQYVYNSTKIITVIETEHFITRGTTVISLGWMELYKNDKNKDDETPLPKLAEKDTVTAVNAVSEKKKTKPPAAYTDSTLLSAMENAGRFVEDEELKEQLKEGGLGTPATRASVIERLITVQYVGRKGKTLYPTAKGMKLIEMVPPELRSPETTGKWEKGLSSIQKGKMDDKRFMGSIERYVRYIVGFVNY
jgi:DNA topoisomerase-3